MAAEGLDICQLAPRLFIVGRPSTRGTCVPDHRNEPRALGRFLEERVGGPGSSFLLVNLSTKTASQWDYGLVGNAVSEWGPPPVLTGATDDLPSLTAVSLAHAPRPKTNTHPELSPQTHTLTPNPKPHIP
jgi:hypothetical protein